MKKAIILLTILSISFMACTEQQEHKMTNRSFSLGGKKVSMDITLPSRIEEGELKTLANYAKSAYAKDAEIIFITYFLKGDKTNSWAYSNFNPELDMKIIGGSIQEDSIMNSAKPEGEIVGKWRVDFTALERTVVLSKDAGNFFLTSTYKDGSGSTEPLTIKELKGVKAYFEKIEEPNQYFTIEKDGTLKYYSDNKYFTTAQPVDE